MEQDRTPVKKSSQETAARDEIVGAGKEEGRTEDIENTY